MQRVKKPEILKLFEGNLGKAFSRGRIHRSYIVFVLDQRDSGVDDVLTKNRGNTIVFEFD